jgi:hypothetical protein
LSSLLSIPTLEQGKDDGHPQILSPRIEAQIPKLHDSDLA